MPDNRLNPYGATLLRISLGVMWLAHGLFKLLGFGIAGTSQYFAAQGFPGWIAGPAVGMEIIGGLAIIAGIHGRLVSLALLPILLGAFVVHMTNGWVFSAAGGGWEYPLFLMSASLVHVAIGDGAYAVGSRGTSRWFRSLAGDVS